MSARSSSGVRRNSASTSPGTGRAATATRRSIATTASRRIGASCNAPPSFKVISARATAPADAGAVGVWGPPPGVFRRQAVRHGVVFAYTVHGTYAAHGEHTIHLVLHRLHSCFVVATIMLGVASRPAAASCPPDSPITERVFGGGLCLVAETFGL